MKVLVGKRQIIAINILNYEKCLLQKYYKDITKI